MAQVVDHKNDIIDETADIFVDDKLDAVLAGSEDQVDAKEAAAAAFLVAGGGEDGMMGIAFTAASPATLSREMIEMQVRARLFGAIRGVRGCPQGGYDT